MGDEQERHVTKIKQDTQDNMNQHKNTGAKQQNRK